MNLKILGAVLILFSGSSIGWIIANQYINRVKQLKELQLALNILATEIDYGQTILSEALKIAAEAITYPISQLFQEAAMALKEQKGETFAKIWSQLLLTHNHNNSLLAEDIKILQDWGQQIGGSALINQSKINSLTIKRLEQAEEKAQVIVNKKVKIARYAGVMLSLLVIIIFF